ncbi:MAG TPA: diaminopimelate decarboxylase [Rhizomicrobium sp.]|nr:diaminopimelate decarboxylase [Rhizomicrobium sp.]
MNHFGYRHGILSAEDVSLVTLAERVGTPFYCYSRATLERHYKVFAGALPADSLVAFSVKSNGNLAVLKTLALMGAGADVVSGGELAKALAAGIPASRIVFSGVGKTREEMHAALTAGIYQFNVESEPELLALDEVARELNKRAPITLRINPDVNARTHAKITTGTAETKFGIPFAHAREAYALAASLHNVEIVGIDVHIGSQLTDLDPFEAAFTKVAELARTLRADGHSITRLDLGGGLGVPYENNNMPPPDPAAYGRMVVRATEGLGCRLIFEPGRLIAANAGVLVSKVLYVKQGDAKAFLILDAGMNDLVRPAMYDAHHEIAAVREPEPGAERVFYDVVGPICETSDLFAAERQLPPLKSGDLVAILSAGAYGAVMSSTYNARPPAPEVLVSGQEWAIVRPRLRHDDLIAQDKLPGWLAG